jgi:uncharacterized FAD-dependent dehydrogenase
MCPGGWVVPAATEADGVVVNGMSLSRRDSPYANSGLVCSIDLSDLPSDPFSGIALQRTLERAAAVAGTGQLRAPATRVVDFLASRASTTVPASSYEPGLFPTDITDVLATTNLPLAARLRAALSIFDRQLRGYATSTDAVLIGVESRTSSPLRIPRDPTTLVSSLSGLYPSGEGAGYAGGIVSAALDGIRIARSITSRR